MGSTLPTSAEPPEIPSIVHLTRGLSAITLANRRALVPAVMLAGAPESATLGDTPPTFSVTAAAAG